VSETSGRTYIETHPWLTFQLDLRNASARFWLLLGETKSKCEHIEYVPLTEAVALEMHEMYFARGVLATAAIEGNTLSEDEVRRRMRGQLRLPLSKEYLGVEIDNMLNAYNDVLGALRRDEHPVLSIETLCSLNEQVLKGLALEDGVVPGRIRENRVGVGGYRAPDGGSVVRTLLERLCAWLNGPDFRPPDDSQQVPYAFIRAVVAHIYLEWIHPFGDGNGRLGRLVEFLILVSSGVPTPAAHLLSSHYMATRTAYYRQLAQASGNGGDLRPFLLYAAQGMVDGLAEQIKRLHKQQELLMWRAIVDEEFHERQTPAAHRQRLLAIELSNHKGVRRADVRHLSTPLADCYSGKTSKTVTRDLNRLAELGFVRLQPGGDGVRANLAKVRGMRPFKAESSDPKVS